MVNITIDNKSVQVPEGTTILNAALQVGIRIPTLCYFKELNDIGACRVCVVEIDGSEKLSAACNTAVDEGMIIHTNSPRVRRARKTNVQLLLSQHNCNCPSCVRSGNCSLQRLANDLNILDVPFDKKVNTNSWDLSFPLIRDSSKCIKCFRCVNVCEKVQDLGIWEICGIGSRTDIGVKNGVPISKASCSLCGQCITHCPVGALRARDDTDRVFDAISDPDKITVVQIAPSIRTAWGEGLDIPPELATEKRMVAAFRALGADYIFDTNFSADLTIMEEAAEFIDRMLKSEHNKLPMFTSCCPGWVRFLKTQYPELVPQLSSAKSPQQMFGAVAKSYYAQLLNVSPEKIFCISIMPCVAKKYECSVREVNDTEAQNDVDVVLTTREITRMLRSSHINAAALPEEEFDAPLGISTGAGVIFGTTGGVMEAALRTAYYLITGKNPDISTFSFTRGKNGLRQGTLNINGIVVRTAVVSGLGNARALIESILNGEAEYDFVEVMACPGGCVGGGGQPIHDGCELASIRGRKLYQLDEKAVFRFSHENPSIQALYKDFMEKPLSNKAHKLLHTDQSSWKL